MNKKKYKAVGQIYREYGVNGSSKFYSYSGGTENLHLNQKYVLLSQDGVEKAVTIKSVSPSGKFLYVHFDIFNKPEEIISWRKAVLWLERKSFIFDEDEEFNFDWEGFKVLDGAGKQVGVIEEIVRNPLRQFSVKTESDKNILIPFVKEWIVDVDKAQSQVKIDFPEGLIE